MPNKFRSYAVKKLSVKNLFGHNVTTKCYQKDFMPTNGCVKPFVGINLAKNRIRGPQIFSTRKWT